MSSLFFMLIASRLPWVTESIGRILAKGHAASLLALTTRLAHVSHVFLNVTLWQLRASPNLDCSAYRT